MDDLIITNARIVDGTGAPWFLADMAIANGRIAAIGRIAPAQGKRAIDATGLVVAPGFIDMMGQTATPFLENPNSAFNLLSQGITTINAGEGGSSAPLAGEQATRAGWSTMRQLFAKLDSAGMPMNMVQTVGHTQLREIVIGDKDRQATPEELEPQIHSTGFFRAKSKALIGMATALVQAHGGSVPADMDALTALPGVGRKTANVVLGHALGVPGLPVDRHVLRVSNRLGLAEGEDAEKVEGRLCSLLPAERWTRASDCLILHGRRVCKPKPLCDTCLVREHCLFFRTADAQQARAARGAGKAGTAGRAGTPGKTAAASKAGKAGPAGKAGARLMKPGKKR